MIFVLDNEEWLSLYNSLNDKFKLCSKPRFSNRRLLISYKCYISEQDLIHNIIKQCEIKNQGSITVGYTRIDDNIESHILIDFGYSYKNSSKSCRYMFDYRQDNGILLPANIKIVEDKSQLKRISDILSM